ncbi:hypothetical protein LE181_17335 [Streptomyces sp. SCA3-4]|uniref:hypothetical protein n=1 Tax=Streptomyces sichuanensis TaxID=2871810 RepID=UPI001CE26301|nr:hypothetical protein [Streptomyces sichuanensis]MCA6093915.1 hypothetical protein [Streptomyces sichuanensis]
MSAQPVSSAGAIPMPPLTPEGLRAAVAQLVPSRLEQLNEHLVHAATQAQELNSLQPLRSFTEYWGIVVAVERDPVRAARFHELEAVVDAGLDPEAARAAVTEIGALIDAEATRGRDREPQWPR